MASDLIPPRDDIKPWDDVWEYRIVDYFTRDPLTPWTLLYPKGVRFPQSDRLVIVDYRVRPLENENPYKDD